MEAICGCLEGDNEDARQVWVRILGLPLHLWGRSLFKQFGDSCGRYVAMDENTTERRNLKWARVLVETSGWQHPSSLQVVAGTSCYALQLCGGPCTRYGSVDPQPPSSIILQPEKLPSPTLGTGAPATDMMGAAAPSSPARAMETGQYPLSQARVEETGQLLDVLAHLSLTCGRPFGPGLGKAQVPISLGSSLKPLGPTPSKALGQESPSCSLRRSGAPSATPSFSRTPRRLHRHFWMHRRHPFPSMLAKPPRWKRHPLWNRRCMHLSFPSPSKLGTHPLLLLLSGTRGLRGGREPGSSPVISMARDVEVTPNPLSIMLRDGLIVILSSTPTSDLGKNMANQRDSSDYPPCEEGWSEEELSKLLHFRLNDCDKRKLIKGVVRNQKADLVCLLETKSLGEFGGRKWGVLHLCSFRNCSDGFSWIFSSVYGPVIGSEKEDFWEELGAIRGLWEDPWCIGGDFNVVRYPEERRIAPRLTADMRRFSEVIEELGLKDIPLAGGPFTWIRGLNSQAASRLDRFLISDQWKDHFSAISQSALPRLVSDHSPIILEAGDLVKSWWNGYSVEGYSSHCIAEKLKALKKDLKKWNKEVVGNVSFNRAEAFSRLQQWEAKENENALNPKDLEAKNLDLEEYKKWALLEETSWRQKSREIWLREGDKNTKDKEGVCNAYQTLLSDPGDWRPSINGLNFKELGEGLASSLEVMFSEEEIFAALSSFCGDKAPGPDGFTMAFWLFCWDVVKPEILGLFREFYLHGTFQRSLNSTFLLLIPKKEGTEI
ncbi:hypothetical protein CK203_083331 [Vitis vinifera]|uniref:Endonuclease/exonuclease/phosphatase domain-containing protein n=1 Tax=Vitis vinifera TaxID=29760 RepID=A0A438BWA8_VITVI|nr:hypothetical protein CK203_083331 [Vitis vinifera]